MSTRIIQSLKLILREEYFTLDPKPTATVLKEVHRHLLVGRIIPPRKIVFVIALLIGEGTLHAATHGPGIIVCFHLVVHSSRIDSSSKKEMKSLVCTDILSSTPMVLSTSDLSVISDRLSCLRGSQRFSHATKLMI